MTIANQRSYCHQDRLITNGTILERHEMATINFLLRLGKNIELIKPSLKPFSRNADLIMDQLVWEMKSPTGRGKYIIRDTLRTVARQSPNIILDLRRSKLHKVKALRDAKKYFLHNPQAQHLLVIIDNQIIDYTK